MCNKHQNFCVFKFQEKKGEVTEGRLMRGWEMRFSRCATNDFGNESGGEGEVGYGGWSKGLGNDYSRDLQQNSEDGEGRR